MRDADGGGQVPIGVEFDRDFDLVAEGFAQLLDRRQRLGEVALGDELVAITLRCAIEWPYLDRPDAACVDQLAHDLFGLAIKVVLVGKARVVQAHLRIRLAANQPIDGSVQRLP